MLNFYKLIKGKAKHNPGYDRHKIDLPFRMLICTASGGGKSNLLMNLITLMTNTFVSITIVTKASEPLYDLLAEKVEGVKVYYYDEHGVPPLDDSDPSLNKLIVFDDLVTVKNNTVNEAFIRGRKLGYSSVYISQSYFMTPKLIRQNVSYIALGRGINQRDLRMILSEYSVNMSLDELKSLYHQLTSKHMHFMLLDLVQNNIRSNILDIVWPQQE